MKTFHRLAARLAFDDLMFKTSDVEMIDECIDLADLAEGRVHQRHAGGG